MAAMENKIDSLTKQVKDIFKIVKMLQTRSDDQGHVMNAISGQMHLHGERLRHIEDDLTHQRSTSGDDDVNDGTPLNPQHDDVITHIARLENVVNAKLEDVTKAIGDVRSDLCQQNIEVENIRTSIDDVSTNVMQLNNDVRANMNRLTEDVSSKIERFIKITSLGNTQLRDEIKTKTTDTKIALRKLKADIKTDIDHKAADILAMVDRVDQKLPSQMVDQTHLDGQLDLKCSEIMSKIDSMCQSLSRPSASTQSLSEVINTVDRKVDEMSSEIESQGKQVEELRREMRSQGHSLIDQVMAEAQVTRGFVSRTPTSRQEYTWHFHITDFSDLVGSERKVYSRVWFIDNCKTYAKCLAYFKTDKTVEIYVLQGCYLNVLGLQPRQLGRFTVNTNIINEDGKATDWNLGKASFGPWDEKDTNSNCDGWRWPQGNAIKTIACDELLQRGLVYQDKVLVTFNIKFL